MSNQYSADLLERYKDANIPKYKIMDSGDEMVCTICNSHLNKIYMLEDAIIGINFPPFHDGCRCVIYPIFD